MTEADARSERVLVVAPFGRDADVIRAMLARAAIESDALRDLSSAASELDEGTGALVVTEEALGGAAVGELLSQLRAQPAWSDVPILVLTTPKHAAVHERPHLAKLEDEANVTLIERPVRGHTLVRAAHSALRARRRQYEMRETIARERAARREVEEASRAKDEFLATVSHELRTPLNAILGWAVLLRRGELADEKRARALDTIERNARVQTLLIEDLLDVSRIVSGTLRLSIEPVDAVAVARESLDVVRPAALAKSIELSLDVEGERGERVLLGDPARIQQIVWNLLSNAVKFTPAGRKIVVVLRWAGDALELEVRDEGEGIAREFLPFVFDRFRQADGTSTRAHGGLGLGLTIVRSLTEMHGGTVDVRSEGVGRGATFAVRLPLREEPRDAAGAAQRLGDRGVPELAARDALAGVRALVVDDEDDAREVVATILEQHGAAVTTVASAPAALAALSESAFDVVVSDIGMAHDDGYALIARIRALPHARTRRVPAIALTAYARGVDRARAIAAGFDAHVPKPLDAGELIVSVARLSARARLDDRDTLA